MTFGRAAAKCQRTETDSKHFVFAIRDQCSRKVGNLEKRLAHRHIVTTFRGNDLRRDD
jgi:hypothetical protein